MGSYDGFGDVDTFKLSNAKFNDGSNLKDAESDAFKRACVSWGIGRFLYRLPIQTLKTKEYKGREYPYAPEKDKMIFDGDTLTKHINWKIQNNK